MKQFSKDLGNVSLAPKGRWSKEQEYERLNLVYNACDNLSYVAKIDVPIGVEIDNREYWQPMNATGYADNNFINLTTESENGTVTAYESLEEAVATILPINRRAGATLSFYNLNADRLDRQAEFELWQFNSTDLANWEIRDYWNNIYYNWNVFAGWYVGADGLKNHVKIPNVGQYAYVGTNLNDALLYQCRTNGTWTNTGIKVRNYISVVVGGNITIGENGNWFSDGKDTGIPATPAVDEQLDNIIMQLQHHTTEINNLKSSDANLQDQITSNDSDITNLTAKHESLSRIVQGIAATGGASTATNVTYNNNSSGLNAENTQDAIDEVSSNISKLEVKIKSTYIRKGIFNSNSNKAATIPLNLLYFDGGAYKVNITTDKIGISSIVLFDSEWTKLKEIAYSSNVFVTEVPVNSSIFQIITNTAGSGTEDVTVVFDKVDTLYNNINNNKENIEKIYNILDKINYTNIPYLNSFFKELYFDFGESTFSIDYINKIYVRNDSINDRYIYFYHNSEVVVGKHFTDESSTKETIIFERNGITCYCVVNWDVINIQYFDNAIVNYHCISLEFSPIISLYFLKNIVDDKSKEIKLLESYITEQKSEVVEGFLSANNTILQSEGYSSEIIVYPCKEGDVFVYSGKYSGVNSVGYITFDKNGNKINAYGDPSKNPNCLPLTSRYTIPEGVTHIKFASFAANGTTPKLIVIRKDIINEVKANNLINWSGKRVLFIGDSITDQNRYVQSFVRMTGCSAINRGVSGTTIARIQGESNSFCDRLDKPQSDNDAHGNGFPITAPDLIFVLGGINDWGRYSANIPFGSVTDEIDEYTFCGALRYLFNGLRLKYPNTPVVVLTMLHSQGNEYPNWNEVVFGENGSFSYRKNYTNKSLKDYHDAIIEVSTLFGFKCIDMFNCGISAVNEYDRLNYYIDGLHPNDDGGKIMAKYILSHILGWNILPSFVE